MEGPRPEPQDRLNIFLPTPFFDDGQVARMTRGGPTWTTDLIEDARLAAGELESRDISYRELDEGLVTTVLKGLTEQKDVGGAMRSANLFEAASEGTYVSLNQLEGTGPPVDRPFAIPEIGLLSLPGKPLAEAAGSVPREITGVAGVRAQRAEIMYAIGALTTEEEGGAIALGYPADTMLESEEMEETWIEAELEAGLAIEQIPWGVVRVGGPRAWALGHVGLGIRVAVIDTGVGPHIDLPAPVASATFVPGSISANDDNGHGTHVAGTIMARRNGLGVVGVAHRAQLLRAKVLGRTGSGSDTAVAAGIVWAANNGARIINLSLGGGFSLAIQRALAYARQRRVAICAAAGNDFCGPVSYPGRDPLCMGIAATDQGNRRAGFSNCGITLDLCAPGVSVLSTWPANQYRVLNGTSMATPHVAGVAALVLGRAPGLDPARLQRHLERTAIPLGPIHQFGRGLVQADRAVTLPILGMEGILAGIEQAVQERVPVGAGNGSRKR